MANSLDTQFIPIGNSTGVRLPKAMIQAVGSKDIHIEEQHGIITISARRRRPGWDEWDAIFAQREAEGIPVNSEEDEFWLSIAGETLKDEPPYDLEEAKKSA